MKLFRVLAMVAIAALLAGCTLSEKQFDYYRVVLRQHPEARAKYLTICIKETKATPRQEIEVIAELMDIKVSNFASTSCKRFYDTFVNGKLTYQDYKAIMQKKPTARVIRILRGKPA